MAEGLQDQEILKDGLRSGMNHVGIGFKAGAMFVPEVLRSAQTMHVSMDILKPLLADTGVGMVGKLLLGTVKGDLHDIGKNLVGMMCEGAGFEVKDLGINIDPPVFIQAVREFQPDIVGISALLTTTMGGMADTIEALEDAGVRDDVKVIIGGAPVTHEFADQIGADGYASNAAAAVDLVKSFVGAA